MSHTLLRVFVLNADRIEIDVMPEKEADNRWVLTAL